MAGIVVSAVSGLLEVALAICLTVALLLLVGLYAALRRLPNRLDIIINAVLLTIAIMTSMMDSQAKRVLAALRSHDVSVETKSNELNELKSAIKHHVVPDGTVSTLFDIIRISTSSQHSMLVGQGMSTLGHLLKRLHLQNPDYLVAHGPRIIPLLIEGLGDRKDRHRALAMQCLSDLWLSCPQDVERILRESAMSSKNPRTKESSMHWLATMSTEQGLQFKSFVPKLMDLLEDADGMVRKTAVGTVVELFRAAPDHAKADLKKQLQQYNVRKTITAEILAQLGLSGSVHPDQLPPAQPLVRSTTTRKEPALGDSASFQSQSTAAPSFDASSSKPPLTSYPTAPAVPLDPEIDRVEPMYINTLRELEDAFREMQPHFEGRESEANWTARERSISKLRKLTKGNAPAAFYAPFNAGIKSLLDGILKTVNSLRTTLSTNGCSLVQDLAQTIGPGLDPMVEILLQNLIKLCAATKNISKINGNATVDILFSNVSYNLRIMQHVWSALQDKNVKPRFFATGWLSTIIKKHGHHKSHIEHTGGLEYMEKSIKKGLSDADIGVRESMRKTYWTFAKAWPDRAEVIMGTLDPNSKRLLEKDPANPNSPIKALAPAEDSTTSLSGRGPTARPSKRSLKDTIAAQKREALAAQKREVTAQKREAAAAAAARDLQNRPASAQSCLSPGNPNSPKRSGAESSRVPATSHTIPLSRKASREARKKGLTMTDTNMTESQSRPGSAPSSFSPDRQGSTTSLMSTAATAPSGLASKPMRPPRRPDPAKPPALEGSETLPRQKNRERADSRPLSVYQDSGTSSESEARPISRRASIVLSELTLNEPAQPSVSALSDALDATLTMNEPRHEERPEPKSTVPEPKDHQRTIKLIDSGIAQVNGRTLDAHGYRKLQSVIENADEDIWQDGARFRKLLLALIRYLEIPNSELKRQSATFSAVHDLKPQALMAVRALFEHSTLYFAEQLPRTICGVITARKYYKGRCNTVRNLERTAEMLYNCASSEFANMTACISDLIDLLEAEERDHRPEGNPMIIMGIQGLAKLLQRAVSFETGPAPDQLNERLGKLIVHCLKDDDSDVRKAAIQYCREYHTAVGGHGSKGGHIFWKVLDTATGDQKNLITYYLSKAED